MRREKGDVKWGAGGLVSQAVSQLHRALGLQWCLKYALSQERMKNWSPPNFKYCIFPPRQTAGNRRAEGLPDQTGSRSQRSRAHPSSSTGRVHRAAWRINSGSTSKGSPSTSWTDWTQPSASADVPGEGQTGSEHSLHCKGFCFPQQNTGTLLSCVIPAHPSCDIPHLLPWDESVTSKPRSSLSSHPCPWLAVNLQYFRPYCLLSQLLTSHVLNRRAGDSLQSVFI